MKDKGINVNDKPLDEYLEEEQSKEIRDSFYQNNSKHSPYKRRVYTTRKVVYKSKKATVVRTQEEQFMYFIDELTEDLQDKFFGMIEEEQAEVWYGWSDNTISSIDEGIDRLINLINAI